MRAWPVCLLALCFTLPVLAIREPIHIDSGGLSGSAGRNPEVRVYKGIPYAAAPVGDLRWRAPKPVAAWSGVRKADQFSPACYQLPYPAGSVYYRDPEPMSEDCLALNVWTAAQSASERRPVMVWIHGGGLTRGSGSLPVYDGEALARKGVVLVTINYRLGVFGFLAHPDLTKESDRNSSGNYSLLDQIAALQWVRRNIAAFGGDPKRVTIFGESAGSWSVNYLVATPLAKGLFERAIGESGGVFGPMRRLAAVEQIGVKFVSTAGASSPRELRAKPAEDIMKAAGTTAFPPNIDGWVLPDDVYTIFSQGHQNDVPTIVGSNADEAKTLAPWPPDGTEDSFRQQIQQRFGELSGEALKLYPAGTADEARESHYASFRDFTFGWQMRTWARLQTTTAKSKAYLYYFDRMAPDALGARAGAFHAAEIAYVFNNLDKDNRQYGPADVKLADEMSSYWVNFAATGDPNGENLPQWKPYRQATDNAEEFGDTVHEIVNLHKDTLDLLDRHFSGLRTSQSTH